MENWVKIKHVSKEGYFVSDLGRVKTVKSTGENIRVGSLRQDGYLIVATGKKEYFLFAFTLSPYFGWCGNDAEYGDDPDHSFRHAT